MLFLKIFRDGLGKFISTAAVVVLLANVSGAEELGATVPSKPYAEANIESDQTALMHVPQPERISKEYAKGYFTDSGRILASPTKWDGVDWLKAGVVIGATSGIYIADGGIRDFAQRNHSSTGTKVTATGDILGNPLYAVPSLGLFYLYGHLNDDPKARRTSLLAVESLIISGAITTTIKLATQRSRPFTGEAPTTWDGPSLKTNDPSFPSIHSQTAFSIASVIAEEYDSNQFVPPIAYGLASFVGLSRIYDNKHWASDVFFGAAIGYFVGKTVVRYHAMQSGTALTILPTLSQQGFGLMTEYRF